jgi:hypothetical protein
MKRRSLFLAIAVAVMVAGFGAHDARAAQIPLPTTLDQLLIPGNFAVVTDLTFADFSYLSSPLGSPPDAADVNVTELNAGIENGISFQGAFFAEAGTVVDYQISYTVTAPAGVTILDALLSGTFNIPTGSTGFVSIGETLINAATGTTIGELSISSNAPPTFDIANFEGVSKILVQKDILVVGGSLGAGVSFVNQGFSVVPEPASLALLGIGMTGFLALRRFFRKTSVA